MSQAIVDGQLSFASSSFERDVDMTGIKTSSSVVFDNATVWGFSSLVGADIGGQLSLNGLHINGPFKAGAARIAKGLFASGGIFNSRVKLTEAKIGDELVIENAFIDGPVEMDAMEVDQSAHIDKKNDPHKGQRTSR
jgi:hypothetical protein